MFRILSLSAILAVAAGGVGLLAASSPLEPGQIRNVVLVHGAYADGSSYSKVIALLRAKGLHVTAVQNPLTSLAADVAATRRALALQDGPVILVGHSSAGVVITEAGNDPKVKGLVFISAIVPGDGESAAESVNGFPPTPGGAEQKPDADGYLSLTRKGVEEDFVPDASPSERALVYATQGDWNSTFLTEKVTTAAWKTRPSWFIVVNDRMVPPEYERAAAKRINATTTFLASGHVPMLSKPGAVADVIIEATKKAGSP